MFKGSTTIRMNEASIIEAVQEYFDARLTSLCPHKNLVKSVKIATATPYGTSGFDVEMEEVLARPVE